MLIRSKTRRHDRSRSPDEGAERRGPSGFPPAPGWKEQSDEDGTETAPGASAWVQARPVGPTCTLRDTHFKIATRLPSKIIGAPASGNLTKATAQMTSAHTVRPPDEAELGGPSPRAKSAHRVVRREREPRPTSITAHKLWSKMSTREKAAFLAKQGVGATWAATAPEQGMRDDEWKTAARRRQRLWTEEGNAACSHLGMPEKPVENPNP